MSLTQDFMFNNPHIQGRSLRPVHQNFYFTVRGASLSPTFLYYPMIKANYSLPSNRGACLRSSRGFNGGILLVMGKPVFHTWLKWFVFIFYFFSDFFGFPRVLSDRELCSCSSYRNTSLSPGQSHSPGQILVSVPAFGHPVVLGCCVHIAKHVFMNSMNSKTIFLCC